MPTNHRPQSEKLTYSAAPINMPPFTQLRITKGINSSSRNNHKYKLLMQQPVVNNDMYVDRISNQLQTRGYRVYPFLV